MSGFEPGYCVSDENGEAKVVSRLEWEEWCRSVDLDKAKRVAETTVNGYWVSTVMLIFNHNWGFDGPPQLYETMIFDKKNDEWLDYQERYATKAEALEGHARAVAEAKKQQGIEDL